MGHTTDLAIIDFAGHPFEFQLAQAFADAGKTVVHSYCLTNTTPHAGFVDGERLRVLPVSLSSNFEKYHVVKRVRHEVSYGLKTVAMLRRTGARCVMAANVPVISLALIALYCRATRRRYIAWVQDIQSGLAKMTDSSVARVAGSILGLLERAAIVAAHQIIVISEGFAAELRQWRGMRPAKLLVIENWASLDEIPVTPKANAFSQAHDLAETFNFVYSGTLGIKHRPGLLLALAEEFSGEEDVRVVLVSGSAAADEIESRARQRGLTNVVRAPFQPFSLLPSVLGTADVLIALLDESAGVFSVPSKVASYLCAGRPVLACIGSDNRAAQVIDDEAKAGLTAEDETGFLSNARRLYEDRSLGDSMGQNGRTYAEREYDIANKRDAFAIPLGFDGHRPSS